MTLLSLFDDRETHLRHKIAVLFAGLALANVATWTWALMSLHRYPVQLGTAFVAYSFGLRHAFDADHIAAIDNVTRKLMAERKRPISTGFFFSLGHSTVVIALSVAIAGATGALQSRFSGWREVGGLIGTSVSVVFLAVVATANIFVFASVYRTFRRIGGGARPEGHLAPTSVGGPLVRLVRPLLGAVGRSWHMYPIGLLFGLGFDTATEVGLLGLSASQASQGLPLWSILVFPALFTAAMSLVDTADSVVMVGAYGWAFSRPIRKLHYNMTITAASVVVALLVGGVEALGLIAQRFGLAGGIWGVVDALNDHFGLLGYVVVAVFVMSWLVSALIYRFRAYDDAEAASA